MNKLELSFLGQSYKEYEPQYFPDNYGKQVVFPELKDGLVIVNEIILNGSVISRDNNGIVFSAFMAPVVQWDVIKRNMTTMPPIYQCSVCGKPVKIVSQGEGKEPIKRFSCPHTDAIIWANRKVTLRGKGAMEAMHPIQKASIKITLTVRQLLSYLTGRSI